MIKQLKIYLKDKKQKYKLQLTALGMALVLSVSGNNIGNSSNETKQNVNNNGLNNSPNISDFHTNLEEVDDNIYMNIINNNFTIDKNSKEEFQNIISNIKVHYDYSELFEIEKFLNKYSDIETKSSNSPSENLIINNKINEEKLYEKVKQNNNNYLKENSGIAKKYSSTNDILVIKACKVIASYLNNYLETNSNVNNNLEIN